MWPPERFTADNIVEVSPSDMSSEAVQIFRQVFTTINVSDLAHFEDGTLVDLEAVLAKGLVSKEKHTDLFKILGDGEVTKKVTVRVDAITKSAQAKIEAAGGSVEMKPQPTRRPKFVKKGQAAPAES